MNLLKVKDCFRKYAKSIIALALCLGIVISVAAVVPVSTRATAASEESGSDIAVSVSASDRKTVQSKQADEEKIVASASDIVKVTASASDLSKKTPASNSDISESDILKQSKSESLKAANIAEGTSGTCSWVIDAEGVLTIKPTDGVSGTLANGNGMESFWPWYDYRADVTSVVVEDGVSTNSNASRLFGGMKNCTSIDLSGLDISNATNLNGMFNYCSSLTTLDVSGFDTTNATSMNSMFENCSSLTTLDVSGFDTSKVTDMGSMFSSCRALTSLDVTNFDTSNVTNMRYMFGNCNGLTTLDVSNFDTSKVTDMCCMFTGCQKLTSLDVTNFDTSNVTNMNWMFGNCSNLNPLNVSNFKTSNVTDMSGMFTGCQKLTDLDVTKFDTSKVTDMRGMFSSCNKLTSLNVSNFKTSNVTDMSNMFSACMALTGIDVSGFDTSKVTNMSGMFSSCRALTAVDVSKFKTSNVTNMSKMFNGCAALTGIDVSGFDTSKVTNMSDMFAGDTKLDTISVSAKFTPATDYAQRDDVNFFNVVDGNLIIEPKDGYAIKSITVGSEEVEPEFDEENGTYTYAGFTGDSVATIIYDKGYTVTFMDNGTEVEKQLVAIGNDAKDPYADTSVIPVVTGKHFTGWDKDITNVQTDLTVNALWETNKYTVTFKDSSDDSVIDEITVEHGNAATAPAAPEHEGFGFILWATEKNGETEADFSNVTEDMTVWAVYREVITGEPSVEFEKESKTYTVGEDIKFKAIGFWADDETSEFIKGDERYVPLNWHHADPSGDFGGKTAPTDDYSASFTQSKAGKYTLKVEFTKYVFNGTDWAEDGIVTVEAPYTVKAEVRGDSDTPDTGDNGIMATVAVNVMIYCAVGMYIVLKTRKKKEN